MPKDAAGREVEIEKDVSKIGDQSYDSLVNGIFV